MLTLQSIHYQIKGKTILNDVSLLLNENDHLLIHGPSGCGKSTLMHIMAGLLNPTSGAITLNEIDYKGLSDAQLDRLRAENFGFVFQKMHLIGHLTARQNIELANPNGLDNAIINDLGIANLMHQKASSLSVGESQRVALARALANNPSVIFADEPTSALDKDNADRVMDMLFTQALKYGACLVVTSHDDRIQSRFDNRLGLSHE
jgi:putative ABC transport system ATP-binding protein